MIKSLLLPPSVRTKVGDAGVIAAEIGAGVDAAASQIRAAGPSVRAVSQIAGVPLQGLTLAGRFGAGLALLEGGGIGAAKLGAAAAQGIGTGAAWGLTAGVGALLGLTIGSAFNCG